jgi:hypothetical protein
MNASPGTKLTCTQCGGELHPDEGQIFLTCPYCSATVYLDPAQVVFHFFLAPTLDPQQALGALYRWMSGAQTVKDLDKKTQVTGQTFSFFPVWHFIYRANGSEQVALQPAAATSITELTRLKLPAGDLKTYDPALDSQSAEPSVPLEAARGWLQQNHPGAEIRQAALVHLPIYIFKYIYKGQTFTALVEAGTGTVLANIFPAKAEAPYLMVGGITALVYLCLAALPMGGIVDTALALILALIAAPILFILAFTVASKV